MTPEAESQKATPDSGRCANGALEREFGTAVPNFGSWSVGAVHLLAADEAVRQFYPSARVALCGELVGDGASELPPSPCPPDREDEHQDCADEHRYCPACVREALRWKADAARIVAQLEQLRELVTRDGR